MTRSLVLFTLLLVACDEDKDSGGELAGASCDVTTTVLDMAAVAPDGQVPGDLLAAISAAPTGTFTYTADSTTTVLSIVLDTAAATAQWQDQEEAARDSSGGEETLMAPLCEDFLQIVLPVTFSTEDGAFDGAETLTLTAGADGRLSGALRGEPSRFGGTFDWSAFDGADVEEIEGVFEITLEPDGASSSGAISAFTSGSDGNIAWAGIDEIGTWGQEVE